MNYALTSCVEKRDGCGTRDGNGTPPTRTATAVDAFGAAKKAVAAETTAHISETLARLRPSNYGNKSVAEEKAELYSIYCELVEKIKKEDQGTRDELLKLLGMAEDKMGVEWLRRQVVLSLLGNFIGEDVVAERISAEHRKDDFSFTFNLRDEKGKRMMIKLPEPLCKILIEANPGAIHAHKRFEEFVSELKPEQRAKIEMETAQYICAGGKRYAFRILYEGKNAVMLIAMNKDNAAGYEVTVRPEKELYEQALSAGLATIKVPEVFGTMGNEFDCGIVMEDCTKGGNAKLACVLGNEKIIPAELKEGHDADFRTLSRLIPNFDVMSQGSIYLRTSRVTGEKEIVLLDLQNCI